LLVGQVGLLFNYISVHSDYSILGVHRISNPAGIPAGFNEFSGIRPDLEKIRPDLNFCFHLKNSPRMG
jgi:hypothetical protein